MKTLDSMILDAKEEFQQILNYIAGDAQEQQIHEVERSLFVRLLQLGLTLLRVFLASKGDGDVGESHTDKQGVKRPRHSAKKEKTYFSIFGKVVIERAYYWLKGRGGLCPLDEQLNLPEDSYSYLLQEWALLLGVRKAYNKVTDLLKRILRIDLWSEPIKIMMKKSCENIDEFYEQQATPEEESEGELLVATVDCKGVPVIKKEAPVKPKKRLKKGEKPGKKKMSTVTAVYTMERHEREVEDVIKEVLETDKDLKGPESKENQEKSKHPKPKNKIVRATMQGKQDAFDKLDKEVERRDPQGKKERVALVDGERKLRSLIKSVLAGFVIILDLYHVLEYLWLAAHVFYKDGSDEAEKWVKENLRLLLTGKVSCIIASLKQAYETQKWLPSKRVALRKVITYLTNGKRYMKYDEYLANGYPIGSGVVEGACRNLVKDRMELAGMRWSIDGADSVLQMRSADVNDLWEDFWEFRTRKEYENLYQGYSDICSGPAKIAA